MSTSRWLAGVLILGLTSVPAVAISQGALQSEAPGEAPTVPEGSLNQPLPSTLITAGPGSDICAGPCFTLATSAYWDSNLRSYRDEMFVPGFGQVSDYGEDWDSPLYGPSNYGVCPTAYAVAPNTPVTIRIFSYARPNFQGLTAISEAVIDCTTGEALSISNRFPAVPEAIPALSPAGLAVLVALLGFAALFLLRRVRA